MSETIYFEYCGKKSSDFYLKLHNELVFTKPERDISFVEVPGIDGDVAIDNKRLKSVGFSFPVSLTMPSDKDLFLESSNLNSWLDTDLDKYEGWGDLLLSYDPGFIYKAIHYSEYDIEHIMHTFGKSVIKFKMKPYKYVESGQLLSEVTNGQTLKNSWNLVAKPYIKITGSGDVKLNIAGQSLSLHSVDSYIEVDTLYQSVTKANKNEFEKLQTFPLPVLNKGNNSIKVVSGNVTKIEIKPRWCNKL